MKFGSKKLLKKESCGAGSGTIYQSVSNLVVGDIEDAVLVKCHVMQTSFRLQIHISGFKYLDPFSLEVFQNPSYF